MDGVAGEISLRNRARRALGVAALFSLGLLPLAIGEQRCTFARLFHTPCPGCGMTRAVHLLQAGDITASLHMNPFAVPVMLAWGAFAASTVWVTFVLGTPLRLWESRVARASVFALAAVYASTIVFWALRALGMFGGPVAV